MHDDLKKISDICHSYCIIPYMDVAGLDCAQMSDESDLALKDIEQLCAVLDKAV